MAGRTLPVTTPAPLSLDSLMARVGVREQPHARRSAPPSGAPAHAPLATPRALRDSPTSIVLQTCISHCACGALHRSPAPYILARYSPNEHSYRYSRADVDNDPALASLPREQRELHTNVPFCEECF